MLRLWSWAVAIATVVVVATKLVPAWEQWYSPHLAYRLQTEALLDGSLSLATDPRALTWDTAWAGGGVQQVWGLGVPLWRLPFEALARLFGLPAFPDRLAFALAFALVACAVLRWVLVPPVHRDNAVPAVLAPPTHRNHARPYNAVVAGVLVLLLFPPLLTMCRTRFLVYEEAAAYNYLAAIALFAITVRFVRTPTRAGYVVLALCAGLVGFVRPTALVYGVASLLVATVYTRRLRWPLAWCAVAASPFALGVGLLIASNVVRFGAPLEFGHSLNLNPDVLMQFATRHGNPLAGEPIGTLAHDLFGFLFLSGDVPFANSSYAPRNWFPGQIAATRWREYYFSVYDLTFLVLVASAWVGCLYSAARRRRGTTEPIVVAPVTPPATLLGLWSFAAAVPLFLFYLRLPNLSSRYLLDFGPAFAVAIWLLARQLGALLRARKKPAVLVTLALAAWWGYQTTSAHIWFPVAERGWSLPVTRDAVLRNLRTPLEPRAPIPDEYAVGTDLAQHGIVFNGLGWNTKTGAAAISVSLYVRDPDCLVVNVAPRVQGTTVDWRQIRAKVGLEVLEPAGAWQDGDAQVVAFHGPRTRAYQAGVQVAFIAFSHPKRVLPRRSELRLLRVRWRCTTENEIAVRIGR
ncbi:MAG TPA: hypothetical protein VIV11_19375 [Kofleriaceae bacterium]